jgi:hypothetical protein
LFGLGGHVGSAEPDGGDPGGIKPPPHLADLVSAALQRENPLRDEGPHNIIRRECGVPLQDRKIPDDPVGLGVVVPGVELPIGSVRSARNISRKVEEVN